MTSVRPERSDHGVLSGPELRGTTFAPAKAFSKGYDAAQVDAFVLECATLVDKIETRQRSLLAQLGDDSHRELRELAVARSRETVATAERAGRAIVSRAQEVAEELRAEALRVRADAHAQAGTLIREANVHAENLLAQARLRATALDEETRARLGELQREFDARAQQAQRDLETRLGQLQREADRARADIRSQTLQLVDLRDDIRVQMQGFLTDMLERVAANGAQVENGAVDAQRLRGAKRQLAGRQLSVERVAGGSGRPTAARRRHRRLYGIAGQSASGPAGDQIVPAPRRGE